MIQKAYYKNDNLILGTGINMRNNKNITEGFLKWALSFEPKLKESVKITYLQAINESDINETIDNNSNQNIDYHYVSQNNQGSNSLTTESLSCLQSHFPITYRALYNEEPLQDNYSTCESPLLNNS